MKQKYTCIHCGHADVVYVHRLNKSLLGAFDRLCRTYEETQKRVPTKIFPQLGMTHNQIANFQKLRYFGLVSNSAREGWWEPTPHGLRFWKGQAMEMDRVATLRKKPLSETDPFWEGESHKPQLRFMEGITDGSYKTREEYRKEKMSQYSLDDLL